MSTHVVWSTQAPNLGRCVAAIGVFDGVHRGHRVLIDDTVSRARMNGVAAVAVTFDRDPDLVVTPDSAAPQLLTLKTKIDLLCEAGIDTVVVIPFDSELAARDARSFLDDVLLAAVDPICVVVGENFRFGRNAAGTVNTLTAHGLSHDFDVICHPLLELDGLTVSSTRIRRLVAQGEVGDAALLLGRPHRVEGPVVHGRGEGARFGVATANITPHAHSALPLDGVYAGGVWVDGTLWPAAISVGRPPSFEAAIDELEAHLIDFEGDLYHKEVAVEFVERLRPLEKFSSTDALVSAIQSDIARTQQIMNPVAEGQSVPPSESGWDSNPFTAAVNWLLGGSARSEDYDVDYVDDPAALAAAEAAVAQQDRAVESEPVHDSTWVLVWGPGSVDPSTGGFELTTDLAAAGIRFAWQPFDPADQASSIAHHAHTRHFELWVPPHSARVAAGLIAGTIAVEDLLNADHQGCDTCSGSCSHHGIVN